MTSSTFPVCREANDICDLERFFSHSHHSFLEIIIFPLLIDDDLLSFQTRPVKTTLVIPLVLAEMGIFAMGTMDSNQICSSWIHTNDVIS